MKVLLWMVLTISVSGGLLFYVWRRVDVVRVGYDLEALVQKKAALEQEHDRLQLRFSQLTAPERIASEVNGKLGMRPPRARQVVLIPTDTENGARRDGFEPPLRVARQTGDGQ